MQIHSYLTSLKCFFGGIWKLLRWCRGLLSVVPCLRSGLRIWGKIVWPIPFDSFYIIISSFIVIFDFAKDIRLHCFQSIYIFQFQDFHFLCPNDTVFDQQHLVCSNWFDVDCQRSTQVWILYLLTWLQPGLSDISTHFPSF